MPKKTLKLWIELQICGLALFYCFRVAEGESFVFRRCTRMQHEILESHTLFCFFDSLMFYVITVTVIWSTSREHSARRPPPHRHRHILFLFRLSSSPQTRINQLRRKKQRFARSGSITEKKNFFFFLAASLRRGESFRAVQFHEAPDGTSK